jgi:hypothetical protein
MSPRTLPTPSPLDGGDHSGGVYGTSPVKRVRRSNAELEMIDEAIIAAVEEDNPVTLRGVFYRVEALGVVPKTKVGYQLVGRQLLKLRRSGRVAYSSITDGTRWITKPTTWTNLDEMLNQAQASYRRALWHRQPTDVMVFAEKDAITGVLLPITETWDVPLGVLRGYCSESFAHSVAVALAHTLTAGDTEEVFVYQLGDHDPSGVDAWRDFAQKVRAFLGSLAEWVHFERLAVTEQQIIDMNLPTRPTTKRDVRTKKWAGGESVEVDAIPARMLRAILEDAITQHIDEEELRITQMVEKDEREILTRLIEATGRSA